MSRRETRPSESSPTTKLPNNKVQYLSCSKTSPSPTPTPTRASKALRRLSDEERNAEKIYLNLLKHERLIDGDDIDVKSPFVVGRINKSALQVKDVSIENGERESRDIYYLNMI